MSRTYTKPDDATLRRTLSPMQYQVTQADATEPPFQNAYWNQKDAGVYVDITTGEPLFSSLDKFDSGTGWPSFVRPIRPEAMRVKEDRSLWMARTEVRSAAGNAHLGHLFPDGPKPTGLRYCINSASLRFVSASKLVEEGYAELAAAFGVPSTPIEAHTDNACAVPAPGSGPSCETTLETAILAGGCFWGMEDLIRKVDGVLDTDVGYTGGTLENPTYPYVKTGKTGHAEALRVVFDPKVISFAELLERWFFRIHDPTTVNRQGNDVGTQYRSVIFPQSPEQEATAREVIAKVNASGKWPRPVATTIEPAGPFTVAEDFHQDYLEHYPNGYTCHWIRP